MKKNIMIVSYFFVIILLSSPILNGTVFAQTEEDPELMFNQAKEHFVNVETIMTHELGHSVGLQHVTDQNNIMYASYTPSYAYCLLS